ncbi:hypothetical protein [Methylobacterium oryzae]|uniref:hypothetical protein n=1 Tax=Methylobacterium oryzae TaxID=334852 RepID=UPI001F31E8F8|nr:hypothetical protein [Methylobacterium oryzae]UIN36300.1 hypothetical protein LXM90_07310 [Methylobacterium oryzae]
MIEDSEASRSVLQQLEALEADPDSSRMVRSALDIVRSGGTPITFDAVLAYMGQHQELSGASMFAALIVRENNRQHVAAVLSAVPIDTAH